MAISGAEVREIAKRTLVVSFKKREKYMKLLTGIRKDPQLNQFLESRHNKTLWFVFPTEESRTTMFNVFTGIPHKMDGKTIVVK